MNTNAHNYSKSQAAMYYTDIEIVPATNVINRYRYKVVPLGYSILVGKKQKEKSYFGDAETILRGTEKSFKAFF